MTPWAEGCRLPLWSAQAKRMERWEGEWPGAGDRGQGVMGTKCGTMQSRGEHIETWSPPDRCAGISHSSMGPGGVTLLD